MTATVIHAVSEVAITSFSQGSPTTQRTLGVGNPTVVKLRDDQFAHLRSTWTAMSTTIDDATQTLEMIGNLSGVFTDDQLQALATMVATKVSGNMASATTTSVTRRQPQTHKYLYNYLTASDCETLKSPVDITRKLTTIVDRSLALGLRHPNELTMTGALAVVAVYGGYSWSPSEQYNRLQELKALWKSRRQVSNVDQTLSNYPVDANDFKAAYPQLYTAELAICDIPSVQFEATRLSMATRKTHRSVNIQSPSQSSQGVPAVVNNYPDWAKHAVFAMLQSFATPAVEGAPGLRVFTPPRRVPEPRALENTPSVAAGSSEVLASALELPIVPRAPVDTPAALEDGSRGAPKSLQEVSAEVRSALAARRGRPTDDGQSGHGTADDDDSVVTGALPKKARTEPTVPVDIRKRQTKSQPKIKAKAKSKSVVVASGTRGNPQVFSRQNPPAMPKLGQVPPIEYCGCRVYSSAADKKWRVLPRPGKSLYDKSFFGGQSAERVLGSCARVLSQTGVASEAPACSVSPRYARSGMRPKIRSSVRFTRGC